MIINFIKDFLRWRRLDHETKCVATHSCITVLHRNDGSETGEKITHMLEFWKDGNDERWTKVITSNTDFSNTHGGIVEYKSDWHHHAILPKNCKRVGFENNVVSLNGGLTAKSK